MECDDDNRAKQCERVVNEAGNVRMVEREWNWNCCRAVKVINFISKQIKTENVIKKCSWIPGIQLIFPRIHSTFRRISNGKFKHPTVHHTSSLRTILMCTSNSIEISLSQHHFSYRGIISRFSSPSRPNQLPSSVVVGAKVNCSCYRLMVSFVQRGGCKWGGNWDNEFVIFYRGLHGVALHRVPRAPAAPLQQGCPDWLLRMAAAGPARWHRLLVPDRWVT